MAGDYLITKRKEAGLLFPSVATGIISSIKQSMIAKRLGVVVKEDMREIDNKLRFILDLG